MSQPDKKPFPMQEGKKYLVRHRIQGVQRYDRCSVMVFLGVRSGTDELEFSARPVAGTQTLAVTNIVTAQQVPDDTPVYMNARADGK